MKVAILYIYVRCAHTRFSVRTGVRTPARCVRTLKYKAVCYYYSFQKTNTYLRMNTFKQVSWAKNLNIDEVMPWEVKNLCNLMNSFGSR